MVLEKNKDDFILFVELGFIAAAQMDENSAIALFRAAQVINGENVLPQIGVGYVHLLKLELQKACMVFEEVLKKDPSNEIALALLGLSMTFTVKEIEVQKGEKMLQEVSKKSTEPTVKKMVTSALDFLEKYIKKQPTPAEGLLVKNNVDPRTING